MSDHIENAHQVHQEVRPVLNELRVRYGIPVRTINATLLGMVTRSMEADIGKDQARDFIESAMNSVWGRPKKSFWQRFGGIFNHIKAGDSKGGAA